MTVMNQGSFITFAERPAVRFERHYAHPVERVWHAITDPDEVRGWFPSTLVLEPRVNGAIHFSDDPNIDDTVGVVLRYDPPRGFAFTWGDNELHLALESQGTDGCVFTLVDVLADRTEAARNAAGWDVCLGELDKLLAGEQASGPHSETATDWRTSYDAYVASGMPFGADIPG